MCVNFEGIAGLESGSYLGCESQMDGRRALQRGQMHRYPSGARGVTLPVRLVGNDQHLRPRTGKRASHRGSCLPPPPRTGRPDSDRMQRNPSCDQSTVHRSFAGPRQYSYGASPTRAAAIDAIGATDRPVGCTAPPKLVRLWPVIERLVSRQLILGEHRDPDPSLTSPNARPMAPPPRPLSPAAKCGCEHRRTSAA